MPTFLLRFLPYLLIIALGLCSLHFYTRFQMSQENLHRAEADMKRVNEAKADAEKKQLELTKEVSELHTATNELTGKVAKEPVTPDEKCMSPVLRRALKR